MPTVGRLVARSSAGRAAGAVVGALILTMTLTVVAGAGQPAPSGESPPPDGEQRDHRQDRGGPAARRTGRQPELVARGRDLYGRHCATCHRTGGRGDPARAVPPLTTAGPALIDFVIRTGRMPLPNLAAPSVRRDPPPLTAEERRAIVAYVATFADDRPVIPNPDASRGELARGRAVYAANCIACHSAFGRGIVVGQRDVAPSLDAASPVEIAEAIRVGPGVMPLFGQDSLRDHDVDSVIRYIDFLTRGQQTPGGITVGRSGPVTEGLVAWFAGMGLLLVVLYLIGEARGE